MNFVWACPKCGATVDAHGKGECDTTLSKRCGGFVCECEDFDTGEHHGISLSDPCKHATCYHCGWGGKHPKPPKGLQKWEKTALENGWQPPPERAEELKGTH